MEFTLLVCPSRVRTACCVVPLGSAVLSSKISYCGWMGQTYSENVWELTPIIQVILKKYTYQTDHRITRGCNELLVRRNLQSVDLAVGKFDCPAASSARRFPEADFVVIAGSSQYYTHVALY